MATAADQIDDDVSDEETFDEAFDEASDEDGGEEEAPTSETDTLEDGGEEEDETPTAEAEEEVVEEEEETDDVVVVDDEAGTPAKDEETDDGVTLEQSQHKLSTLGGMYNSEIKKRQALEDELKILKEGEAPNLEDDSSESEGDDVPLDDSALMEKISEIPSIKALTEEYDEVVPQALKEVASVIYSEVANDFENRFNKLAQSLNPLFADHDRVAGDSHFGEIEKVHSDFDAIVESGKIQGWIESQPPYKKAAYEAVFNDGATSEVIDLFHTFKVATGYKAPEKEEENLEEEINTDELDDMEAVDATKRPVSSGKKGGANKNDFNAGWDDDE